MALEPLHLHLEPATIPLAEIYLDPNNPRFVGPDWQIVSDDEVDEQHHQDKASSKLLREFGADKLRASMEINGYLPIDRIIVRKLKDECHVVLEGNRRIAAAKTIGKFASSGEKISPEVLNSLKDIPVLIYTGVATDAAWVFQGLRHISGVNDWSAYNKARLLVEQMDKEGMTQTEVGRRFGLTSFGAGQWVRGYHAFRQVKNDTDYSVEVDERIYPYLQELFGRSSIPMREWLDWNETDRIFKNIDRLNEFVGWFYPRIGARDGLEDQDLSVGDWEKRHIGKRDDIRQLAFLVQSSPKNFELFRSRLDLEDAYGKASFEAYEQKQDESHSISDKVLIALKSCTRALESIPLAMLKRPELKIKLDAELELLRAAIRFASQ